MCSSDLYFVVPFIGPSINRKIFFVGVEVKMLIVIIGEVIGILLIADDENLHEAKEGIGISVSNVIFIVNDLLQCPARAYIKILQLYLNNRQAID